MTYFGYLALFFGIPLLVLAALLLRDARRRIPLPADLRTRPSWLLMTGLAVVAMLYTTPWDNHLIAQRTWTYSPALVSGLRLDHLPLEEFLFFSLQSLVLAMWLLWLAKRAPVLSVPPARHKRLRLAVAGVVAACWAGGLALLLGGWQHATYLGWELAWALPPLIVQLAVGADLLWRRRHLFLMAVVPAVLYLSVTDALAITRGIWTISPAQSLGMLLGGVLPIEEVIFFLLTSLLVITGMLLGLALPIANPIRASWRGQARPVDASRLETA